MRMDQLVFIVLSLAIDAQHLSAAFISLIKLGLHFADSLAVVDYGNFSTE